MDERATSAQVTDPAGGTAVTGGRSVLALLGVGLASGFFAGLFGIGGGLIIVPALVVLLAMDQRRAVGTSLVAILPAILVSVGAYAVGGGVDWRAGLLLAVGAVTGAQIGVRVLLAVPRRAVQWAFVALTVVMVVQLVLTVPDRGQDLVLDPLRIAGLVALGLFAGVLSSLLGIGGGGVVVPALMLVFGVGDLVAKGASLVMMVPGVLSGLTANLRRRNVDVRAGAVVGAASLVTSPLGAWTAHAIPPRAAAVLFAAFLVVIGTTMAMQALQPTNHPATPAAPPAPAEPVVDDARHTGGASDDGVGTSAGR
ncbi:sulfite exporter TauE/SafE family protein [Cellulomonas oligotrophica]|uniref:Probable membrane transporter protein n=1 Tax=Cellulomonas oligotrophica TaxID=931536 RepID=A0A7Y9FFB4_9CELL|nr:sulfite exporter TauE/SafE family protein [Cellulomonas oligotrophica]NYD86273.1 hypothetical protein [Cellulomonas oligotrophica]